MSNPGSELQFERAEPNGDGAPPQAKCVGCGTPLSSYFEVCGNVACENCKDAAVARQGASHLPTLLKGGLFGFAAAAVGAGIYYAIAEATGYEFGLMSIVLGLMVGFAVRRGSRGRGGWRYQVLAMFLCYAAICATYVPRVISAIRKHHASTAASNPAPAGQAAADAAPKTAAATPVAPPAAVHQPSAGEFAGALAQLFLFTLALPFLAGFENIMGLVIIGIGLYEAWKVNRGIRFSVSGPFSVGEARSG